MVKMQLLRSSTSHQTRQSLLHLVPRQEPGNEIYEAEPPNKVQDLRLAISKLAMSKTDEKTLDLDLCDRNNSNNITDLVGGSDDGESD